MSDKTNKDDFVVLHSQGGKMVYVPHPRHRLFIKDADELVMKLDKKIEERTRET